MISIVMPYWKRPDLLVEGMWALEQAYKDKWRNFSPSFELVIVNDGDKDFPSLPPVTYPVSHYDLPDKDEALNPCVPFNYGVARGIGDIIVLSSPEIIHITPILTRLTDLLGDNEYRAAAVWDVERKMFLCDTVHSILRHKANGRAPKPKNAGLHFCAALTKKTFLAVGGYDERYREGQAFDDNDLLWRLHKHGIKFSIHDDLLVEHHQTKTQWPKNGHASNAKLFHDTWHEYIREHGDD